MNTIAYVDGFNLYYGAVKDTPYKWLDIAALCRYLLPHSEIKQIKYFTALISARLTDPGKPARLQTYIRALSTLPEIKIVYGSFLTHERWMPIAGSSGSKPAFIKVVRTEEKGSDVNLAAHLVHDAHEKAFELAVLITNDSDLLEAIKIIRYELGLPIGILNPQKKPSRVLMPHISFIKQIRKGVLAASQFPDMLTDTIGIFHKPREW